MAPNGLQGAAHSTRTCISAARFSASAATPTGASSAGISPLLSELTVKTLAACRAAGHSWRVSPASVLATWQPGIRLAFFCIPSKVSMRSWCPPWPNSCKPGRRMAVKCAWMGQRIPCSHGPSPAQQATDLEQACRILLPLLGLGRLCCWVGRLCCWVGRLRRLALCCCRCRRRLHPLLGRAEEVLHSLNGRGVQWGRRRLLQPAWQRGQHVSLCLRPAGRLLGEQGQQHLLNQHLQVLQLAAGQQGFRQPRLVLLMRR